MDKDKDNLSEPSRIVQSSIAMFLLGFIFLIFMVITSNINLFKNNENNMYVVLICIIFIIQCPVVSLFTYIKMVKIVESNNEMA